MPSPAPQPTAPGPNPAPPQNRAPLTDMWEVLASATGTGLSLRAFEAMLDRIEQPAQ